MMACGFVALFLLASLTAAAIPTAVSALTSDSLQRWADSLGSVIVDQFAKHSRYKTVEKDFLARLDEVRLERISPEKLLQSSLTDLYQLFSNRTQALQNIAEASEAASVTHRDVTKLRSSQVHFVNMQNASDATPPPRDTHVQQHDATWRHVNWNTSGVRTPLEVYEGWFFAKFKPQAVYLKDGGVLNGLRWLSDMNAIYAENRRNNPGLVWQYVAAERGFLQLYPATWWPSGESAPKQDQLFDARRRTWYTRAASARKDILIMMDVSGSVYGHTFEIMKVAVKSTLNLLGEGDYVGIVMSNSSAAWVHKCAHRVSRATTAHRRRLASYIDLIEPLNVSNWAAGLDFVYNAFDSLYNGQRSSGGAHCNPTVMLLTDGGTEWPQAALQRFVNGSATGWTPQHVKILTYALGPHPVPAHVLRRMACETGGVHTAVVSSGAVRSAVRQSLQQAMSSSDGPWRRAVTMTPAYRDALGLGYVLTLAMPVFNRSSAADNSSGSTNEDGRRSGELLAVAGVDVSLTELTQLLPAADALGPLGYAFAVNHEGTALLHPLLPSAGSSEVAVTHMDDVLDVDVAYLEGGDDALLEIRSRMIDGLTGSMQRPVAVLLHDLHAHAAERRMLALSGARYTYARVEDTQLSVVLVTADTAGRLTMSQPSSSKSASFTSPRLGDNVLLAPSAGMLCANLSLQDGTRRWRQVSQRITAGATQCDADKVRRLLWELDVTAAVEQEWRSAGATANMPVQLWFAATGGGLIRRLSRSVLSYDDDVDAVSPDEEEDERLATLLDPYTGAVFRQALAEAADGRTLLRIDAGATRVEDNDGEPQRPSVLAFRRLDHPPSQGISRHPLAVVGTRFSGDWLLRVVLSSAEAAGVSPACASRLHHNDYHHQQEYGADGHTNGALTQQCWLLDDSAQVLLALDSRQSAATDDAHDRFFGQLEPWLMQRLVNDSVFSQHVFYNPMGVCTRKRGAVGVSSSPDRFFMSLHWMCARLLSDAALFIVHVLEHVKYLIVSLMLSSHAPVVVSLDEFGFETNDQNYSCSQRSGFYQLATSLSPVSGQLVMDCVDSQQQCRRQYSAVLVKDTNLLLVVADGYPMCATEQAPPPRLPYQPEEVDMNDEPSCHHGDEADEDLGRPLYRRRPTGCSSADVTKKKRVCSSAGDRWSMTATTAILFLSVVVSLMLS